MLQPGCGRVAAFFAEAGSITINRAEPSVGRDAITAAAQGFITDFPDMVVAMDSLGVDGARIACIETLSGTNTGQEAPAGPFTSGVLKRRLL